VVVTGSAPDTTPPTQPQGLSATAGGPTSVSLSWTASTDDAGVVGYALFRDGIQVATPAGTSFTDQTAQPDHTYSYEVEAYDQAGNRSARSAPASVTTPAMPADPVIAAAGDIACDPSSPEFNGGLGTPIECQQVATSNLLLGGDLSAVLALGDLQYSDGALDKFMASYDPSWGRVKAITRPSTGNREYKSGSASGYFTYFGATAGDPTKGYYSFDVGAWHLIALNSNCSFVACGNGSAQLSWLQADLAAHPAACTLAFFHHPRWSSSISSNGSVSQFWDVLYDANVDVILNGHAHGYERFAPMTPSGAVDNARGIRPITVGTGGEDLATWGAINPNSQVRGSAFGVLRMTLRAGSYDWQFVPIPGATFTDSGSGTCH
jgi:3',5'-cyclic AMP phosphodiesterase CpdA